MRTPFRPTQNRESCATVYTVSIVCNSSNKKHTIDSTQTSFLNEVETWKGKKDKALKHGKYLRVCPDIDSIHKKSHFTSKTLYYRMAILTPTKYFRPTYNDKQYMCI